MRWRSVNRLSCSDEMAFQINHPEVYFGLQLTYASKAAKVRKLLVRVVEKSGGWSVEIKK